MDSQDVDPPERQADKALRDAMYRILTEGSRWAREQHGINTAELDAAIEKLEREARPRYPPYPECDGGPDCQCPFHWAQGWHEAQQRAAFSTPPPQLGQDTWPDYPGECTACGMDDGPVKGPPGAELCTYCDQLRIEPPRPVKATEPRRKILMLPQGPLQIPHPPDLVLWAMIVSIAVVMGVTFALFLLSLGNP